MGCNDCKNGDDFASKANQRITIQKKNLVTTGSGGQTNTWSDELQCYAYMIPLSGYEQMRSEQLQSRVTHKIVIRFKESFANTRDFSTKRILFKDRIFNIRFIRNLDSSMKMEGRVFHEITAEENAAEAA